MKPQGGELRNVCIDARIDRQAGVFLSLSVCRCIYGVELWKKEGAVPSQIFLGSLREHGQEHGQNGP